MTFPETRRAAVARGRLRSPVHSVCGTPPVDRPGGSGPDLNLLPRCSRREIRSRFALLSAAVPSIGAQTGAFCPDDEEESMSSVSMTVNGKAVSADVDPRTLLVQFLREHLRLTGTHVGCDTSQCGACVVHVDGKAMKSCTIFAWQPRRRQRADHDRRARRTEWPAAPDAGGVPRQPWPSVRILPRRG